MAESEQPIQNPLDPAVLAKVASLELRARLVVEGFITGMHTSPYQGYSVEFAQHRPYVPGDEIRHVDWKVFARTDKFYLKQYQEETNLTAHLVLDASESMDYGSSHADSNWNKFEYARSVAAAIAYLAVQQQDSVGLTRFSSKIDRFLRPSNLPSHWKLLVQTMQSPAKGSKTQFGAVLEEVAERMPRRGLVILISDCFDNADQILRGLSHLRYRRHEVIVFHILDPTELTFPFEQLTRFEGLEGHGDLLTDPRTLRTQYLEQVDEFIERLRRGCRDHHIDYQQINTSMPLDLALSAYLSVRAARTK